MEKKSLLWPSMLLIINSYDPPIFRTSLTEELLLLIYAGLLDVEEVEGLVHGTRAYAFDI